jgi:hypothetical protein
MIAALHIQLKQYDQGLQVINTIDNPNDKAILLLELVSKYRRLDKDQKADVLLSKAAQITEGIDNPEEKSRIIGNSWLWGCNFLVTPTQPTFFR